LQPRKASPFAPRPRHRDAFASCCPSNKLAQNLVILVYVKARREEAQLQTRRDMGDLVKLAAVLAIFAVTFIAVAAFLNLPRYGLLRFIAN
jgi:hypothetical protein